MLNEKMSQNEPRSGDYVNPATIAKRFHDLDFHDDTFIGMRVLPTKSRGDNTGSVVEIEFLQHSELKARVLRFTGCTNLRVGVDLDVLAHNLPPNTYGVDAHTDKDQMGSLMQSQTRDWGVQYATDMSTPLDRKLDVLNEFVCFRVQLCGGIIEMIARQYQVEAV